MEAKEQNCGEDLKVLEDKENGLEEGESGGFVKGE